MTFLEAQKFIMPYGKYKGKSLDDIATDDEGLKYLDWMVGEEVHSIPLKLALKVYMNDGFIKGEIKRSLDMF